MDIKTQVKEAVTENNESLLAKIKGMFSGDPALQAKITDLTNEITTLKADVLSRDTTITDLNSKLSAKDGEITTLKTSHVTELAEAKKTAGAQMLAKTGVTAVTTESTETANASGKKADELRAELATANEERKSEILAELRILRGVDFNGKAKK